MAANIITLGCKLLACDTEEPHSESKNGKLNNLTSLYGLDCLLVYSIVQKFEVRKFLFAAIGQKKIGKLSKVYRRLEKTHLIILNDLVSIRFCDLLSKQVYRRITEGKK